MTEPSGPVQEPKKKSGGCLWPALVSILIVGGCSAVLFHGGSGDTDSSSGSSDGTASAIVLCHETVKEQLKSPSSAKFGWGNDSTSVRSGTVTNGMLIVTGVVDADNSFGASLRSSWTCAANVVDGEATQAQAKITEG